MGQLRYLPRLTAFMFSVLITLSSFATADDAAVMSKLLAALKPAPSGWSAATSCCNWKNVKCDSSNRVTSINLASKSISGTLPSDLRSLTQLTSLSLQQNSFSGPLPSLANLSFLQEVYLDKNDFTCIPPDFFQGLTSLRTFSLDDNSNLQTWTIPTELTEATSLVKFYASNASVYGSLPDIFASFPSLKDLRLSYNSITGTISPAFGNLTSLRTLALANNDLTGSIPDNLATLPDLQVLDVSNNNLNGFIPKFASTVKFTRTGNPLLGTTAPSSGIGAGTPSTDSNSTTPSGSSAGTASGGTPVSPAMIVIAVVIFLVAVLFVSINWESQSQSSGDRSHLHVWIQGYFSKKKKVSIQDLRQATNNFSEENILGRGGFGDVYKGELHDGTKIAVKRMRSVAMDDEGMNQFQTEIAVLTRVRHRHLVALLGYCVNGNERLLVYEYMPQGTLTQHLFDRRETALTWKQRVTIALDVAHGLVYLHRLAQQCFIHRDLKSSNILLGDDMRAKVADFGLVKEAPDDKHSVVTQLKGTFGYFAPEYFATRRVTTKVDVYAFGVVLLELITGRRAVEVDDTLRGVQKNKENIQKAIDQTLNPNEETMESIYKVAELAGCCTAREPDQRPEMGQAVHILSPLVEQWKPLKKQRRAMALT